MSNTTIQLRKSGQTGNTPADLAHGELAINYADGKLFYKNGVGIKAIENQKTFSTINVNNSLIIATSPTDILNIIPGNNVSISTNTTSKTITINSTATGGGGGGDLAAAAYAQANNASGNTVALQAVNTTQNTNITSVNTFAQSAFNEANTKVESFYQNTTPSIANTGDIWVNSDTGFEYTNFGNVSTPIWAETGPTGIAANTLYLQAVNDLQNTNIISINTFTQAAFDKANTGSGGDLAAAAYAQANSASGNTVALQAVNTTQNTNITSVNTFAQSGFNSANAGVTLATAAYGKANAEGTINNTQNNWIAWANTFAQSAYNTANLKFNTTGGTITGNVTIQNNLVVQGNLSVLGNSTTISTSTLAISDPLIFLANGNIVTDVLDIGIIGHYGGPSGETHTGIFRDPNLKEWIVFQGYTTQIQSNNLINIADPSFAYANLYANVVKSNLISTYAVVNGLNVFSTMSSAFASANAGVTLATAAYGAANTAASNTVYLQAVNDLQNTNITAVNTFAQAAYNQANTGGGGGGGSSTGYLANSVIFADSTGTLSNTANLKFTSTNNVFEVNGEIHIANTRTASFGSIIFNAANNSIDFIITI